MIATITWVNTEKTVLLLQVSGAITVKEVRSTLKNTQAEIAEVDHAVDLIIDGQQAKNVPPRMFSVMRSHLTKLAYRQLILVGLPMLPRMLLETLTRISGIFKQPPIFVDTLEEAYQRLDVTIPTVSDKTEDALNL